jgi:hypothetical protein
MTSLVSRPIYAKKFAFALAIVALFTAVTLTGPLAVSAHAATKHPFCISSQIRVTTGATLINSHYPETTSTGTYQVPAYEAVPVFFYNKGANCHLRTGAPSFVALRNTRVVSARTPSRDLSMAVGSDNTKRMIVPRHQEIEALFVVIKPVGLSFRGCEPATTSGLIISGYARPIDTKDFVVRHLRDVCFDSSAGSHISNIGAIWTTSH